MSIKKQHLYRNKIEEAVRDFIPADAEVIRDEESAQRVKFIINFSNPKLHPATLIVDYNNDGTTTLEDCRGKNKDYSIQLAEYVVRNTQVQLYNTDNLYFTSISDEQFSLFMDFMADCNVTMTSTSVANGDKYTLCGEYGDTIYATRYNNGSIFFQGHPSITFNNVISILSDIYPSDIILARLTKYYKIDFDRTDLEKELFSHCPKLLGNMNTDIINAILPTLGLRRAIPEGLTDYSYLCFPLLRGLEGLIKAIFKDKGVALPAKKNFGGYLKYDDTTLIAEIEQDHVRLFPDTTERTRVENLYALLCQQRHRIFHLDPFSPILLDKENALDIVEETLKRMNDTY